MTDNTAMAATIASANQTGITGTCSGKLSFSIHFPGWRDRRFSNSQGKDQNLNVTCTSTEQSLNELPQNAPDMCCNQLSFRKIQQPRKKQPRRFLEEEATVDNQGRNEVTAGFDRYQNVGKRSRTTDTNLE